MESNTYDCDCNSKIVLDVVFKVESAVFFSRIDASKMIISEPVTEYHPIYRENVRLNQVNAEIHVKGVSDKDRVIAVPYVKTDNGFELSQKEHSEMKMKVRNVTDIIDKSGADVANIDYEDAEKYFVNISNKTLGKISSHIIEIHSPEI